MPFYTDMADSQIAKDILSKACEVRLQALLYYGTATLDLTTPATAVLTFTDFTMVADALISGKAPNILLQDDDGKVVHAYVADNDTTTITLDLDPASTAATAPWRHDDGVATSIAFTTATTYKVKVFTPSNTTSAEYGAKWGVSMGWTNGGDFNLNLSENELKAGIDHTTKRVTVSIDPEFTTESFNPSNPDILQAAFGAMKLNHTALTGTDYAIGGGLPRSDDRFRLFFHTRDVQESNFGVWLHNVQLFADGSLNISAEISEKSISLKAKCFKEELLPDETDTTGKTRDISYYTIFRTAA